MKTLLIIDAGLGGSRLHGEDPAQRRGRKRTLS